MMNVVCAAVGPLGTNAYLVSDPVSRCAVLIDPGAEAPRLLGNIREAGLELSYLLLTHGHFDHIGAVAELLAETGAKLVAPANELPVLQDATLGGFEQFGSAGFSPLTPDVALHEGETLTVGRLAFTLLETPGHTQGSACYRVEDALFTGDTLFAGSCGRFDLPGGDAAAIMRSLKRLGEIPEDLRVYPGHGEASTLDTERAWNPYLREAARL